MFATLSACHSKLSESRKYHDSNNESYLCSTLKVRMYGNNGISTHTTGNVAQCLHNHSSHETFKLIHHQQKIMSIVVLNKPLVIHVSLSGQKVPTYLLRLFEVIHFLLPYVYDFAHHNPKLKSIN